MISVVFHYHIIEHKNVVYCHAEGNSFGINPLVTIVLSDVLSICRLYGPHIVYGAQFVRVRPFSAVPCRYRICGSKMERPCKVHRSISRATCERPWNNQKKRKGEKEMEAEMMEWKWKPSVIHRPVRNRWHRCNKSIAAPDDAI